MKTKNRIAVSVFITAFAFGLNITGVLPILGILNEKYQQYGTGMVQQLQTMPYLMLIVGSLLVGWLTTRISKKKIVITGLIVIGICGMLPFFRKFFDPCNDPIVDWIWIRYRRSDEHSNHYRIFPARGKSILYGVTCSRNGNWNNDWESDRRNIGRNRIPQFLSCLFDCVFGSSRHQNRVDRDTACHGRDFIRYEAEQDGICDFACIICTYIIY